MLLTLYFFVGVTILLWPGLIPAALAQDFTLAGTNETFPLNGVIDINMIGEGFPVDGVGVLVGGNGALVCHTDDTTCCRGLDNPNGGGRGEWYLPGEITPIPAPGAVPWYRSRDVSVLRLNRRLLVATTPTGVYRCNIPTTSGIVDKFIGVYNAVTVALCPNLNVDNGVVIYDRADIPGKIATYLCSTGYTLSGSSTRVCISGSGWDGSEPTCVQDTTTSMPTTIMATTPSTATTIVTTPSTATTIVTTPSTATTMVTTPSTATTMTPVAVCPSLTLPLNGLTITYNPPGSPTSQGTVATYQCITGYTPNPSTRTCQSDGTWSGGETTCQPSINCGQPPDITNGSPGTPDRTTTGGMVTYTCETGYEVSPGVTMMTSLCQASGMWDTVTCTAVNCGPPPSITNQTSVDCGSPPSIANGSPGTPDVTTFGGSVTFTCDSGYQLSGSSTVTCVANGSWSTRPTCTATCDDLSPPDNGAISYNPDTTPKLQGNVATYTCNSGYTGGPVTRTCQPDRTWSGTAFTCTSVDCGTPPNIANGSPGTPDRTTFGGTVTYTCDSGYQISPGVTMMTSSCQVNGMWDTVTCTAVDCGQPPNIANGSPGTPDMTTFGETVTYTCDDGLTLSGQAMITCLANGMWSTPPSCLADCILLSAPDNGQVVTTGTTYRDTATYSCNEGYNLIGSRTLTCGSGGMWTPTLPSCSPVPCGQPPAIANGSPGTPTSTAFEGAIAYSCNTGYIIIGSITITCLSTGSWSSPPVCQPLPPVYLTLSDANHISGISEIPLSSVGEGANSLSCHTDDVNCCRVEDAGVVKGVWHYPNGSIVSSDSGDLYTTREGPMVVNLNRRDGVDGPTGLYCCEIPTSIGTGVFCANLIGPALGSPSTQCDNTGAIVGGVVAIVLIIAFSITAVLIAYIILRQRRTGGVNLKRGQPNIPLTDKGQSVIQQTYETVDTTYEEIDGTRPLKGNYDYTQNQAYATNTAPLRGEGVVNTGGSGNPTGVSQVGRDEEKIYEN